MPEVGSVLRSRLLVTSYHARLRNHNLYIYNDELITKVLLFQKKPSNDIWRHSHELEKLSMRERLEKVSET